MSLAALLVVSTLTQGFGIMKCPDVAAPAQNTMQLAQNATQPTQNATQPALAKLTVDLGDMPALGSASAPVTFVQFSDYQCPFCAKLYNDAEAQIKTNYIDTNKVKMYFRDYPLPFHPNALPAAIAARCADDGGKFWEMHHKLFTAQSAWSSSSDAGTVFKGYATELGLDATKFASCYDAQTHSSEISADMAEGQSYGVGGTPSNFLLIPKGKISYSDVTSAVSSLNSQYGDSIELFENDNEYVVLIPGAFPYAAFDAVLSKVSY